MIENEPVVLCGLSEQEAAERRARGLGNDAKLKTDYKSGIYGFTSYRAE